MDEAIPRRRVTHPAGGRVMTKQADMEKSDINHLVARWISTGSVPMSGMEPRYGDFADAVDYHQALSRVRDAEADFEGLPSAIRKYCKNDPGQFLDLVMDPERRGELEELGLVETQAPPSAPEAVPARDPEPEGGSTVSPPSEPS